VAALFWPTLYSPCRRSGRAVGVGRATVELRVSPDARTSRDRRSSPRQTHALLALTHAVPPSDTPANNTTRMRVIASSPGAAVTLFADLVESSDEKVLKHLLTHPDHVLLLLLPARSFTAHSLRPRWHDRALPCKQGRLFNNNFSIRMLFTDS